ncbi:NiFe hydrogenase [Shewanella subflava]|uniref:NiFe hydrogenase n=1 Tax=Shewanella subflava TaxID=2986476 RepID=A0ABT3ICL4_9GAMM|nr:NiFe hydrogenase [Shewanella subflava]MCW3173796.1 NiFe hydrogenase [Shewanella subflava]
MKHIIQFEFICLKSVPLYEHLCQLYARSTEISINFGIVTDEQQHVHYFIEAYAEQAELEHLADNIAADFLLSVWLIDTNIQRMSEPQFPISAIQEQTRPAPLLFCQHCQPLFGDNQSPHFGKIDLVCHHCHGETELTAAQRGLTQHDIHAMVDTLLTKGELALNSEALMLSIKEPLQPTINQNQASYIRPHILICNPNTLNAQLTVNDYHVLALSSIEKPILTLASCDKQHSLENCTHAVRYDVQFAYNRLLQVICERLRQKGINWVYLSPLTEVENLTPALRLARVNQHWIEIGKTSTTEIKIAAACLHQQSIFSNSTIDYIAEDKSTSNRLPYQVHLSCAPLQHTELSSLSSVQMPHKNIEQHLGYRALLGCLSNCPDKPKHAAVLYFSQQQISEIATIDGQSQYECFFNFAEIPQNGYEICHQLLSSKQAPLLVKYKQQFPQSYLRLLDLKLHNQTANLSSLLTLAAIIIGCPVNEHAQHAVHQQLLDGIISSAECYRGNNAPRIDFPLIKGEAVRSLNWCKTLATLMSFKIAGEEDKAKLAYGFFDSFADFLSNWLEHLDQNIGIKQIVLAGSEFSYPPLAKQIQLRIGKNFPLTVNPQLDLEGANIAIGGLLLPIRRRGNHT